MSDAIQEAQERLEDDISSALQEVYEQGLGDGRAAAAAGDPVERDDTLVEVYGLMKDGKLQREPWGNDPRVWLFSRRRAKSRAKSASRRIPGSEVVKLGIVQLD